MKRTYTHLTQSSRYTISAELKSGKPHKCIAADLGKHRSTLWRERKRNCNPDTGNYNPVQAHNRSQDRRKLSVNPKQKPRRASINTFGKAFIAHLILKKWSPEQISGSLAAVVGLTFHPMSGYTSLFTPSKVRS